MNPVTPRDHSTPYQNSSMTAVRQGLGIYLILL